MEILIISGLSGAGKSRVAAALEDLDFYCVDNLPVAMMPKFAELILATRSRYERVAMVIDVRATQDAEEIFEALEQMKALGLGHRILFVEADVDTIVKRYKETRRRHPLDTTVKGNIESAVRREIKLFAKLREQAEDIIDTTGLTLGNLQRRLLKKYSPGTEDSKALSVSVKSFGYKYGIPIEADLVFDVRFMPNPYYISELQDKTGLDSEVRDYIFKTGIPNEFIKKLSDLVEFLLPQYVEEGKRYLIITIGCTGGRHRSVAVASILADFIAAKGYPVDCIHRDIDK